MPRLNIADKEVYLIVLAGATDVNNIDMDAAGAAFPGWPFFAPSLDVQRAALGTAPLTGGLRWRC